MTAMRGIAARRSVQLFMAVCAMGLGSTSMAQSSEAAKTAGRSVLAGWVRDSLGHPIPFAAVSHAASATRTVADDSGWFRLAALPAGKQDFAVRRIGYVPMEFDVELRDTMATHVDIRMNALANELGSVDVTARSDRDIASLGFYRRKDHYVGATFLDPAEVAARNASLASSLLETVRGVDVLGKSGRRRVVLHNTNCDMAIWVDGAFMRSGRAGRSGMDFGAFDELVSAGDVYAMEVYTHAPGEFQAPFLSGQKDCGAVVIWTRLYRLK
jgi:hypothetical protein